MFVPLPNPPTSLPPGSTLVQTLLDLGPDITSDPDSVHALMSRFGITTESPPTAAQAMETISSLSRAAVEGRTLCDVNALMTAFTSFVRTPCPMFFPPIILMTRPRMLTWTGLA